MRSLQGILNVEPQPKLHMMGLNHLKFCRIFDTVQYESKDQLLFDENANHTERTCTQTTSISRGHSSTFDYIPFLPIEYTFILSNGVKSH